MLKFHCSHCGGRLALQERHLGRLVHCPDCGGVTHPMAGEILARQKKKEKDKVDCDNCGQALGRLQKPRRWGKCSVCGPCYRALRTEQIEQDRAISEASPMAPAARSSVVSVRTLDLDQASAIAPLTARRQLPAPAVQAGSRSPAALILPPGLASSFRTAAMGLLVCAAAVIVAMYVLRAIGSLLLWSACVAVGLGALLLIARMVFLIRRRMHATEEDRAESDSPGGSIFKRLLRAPATHQAARTALLILISGGVYLMYLVGSAALSRTDGR